MANAATGSLAAVVRTTASIAAVDGVAGASGAAPAASREGLEELRVGLRRPELVGRDSPRRARRARPSGRAAAMTDSVTGSSRSMCLYCSA